LEIFRNMVEAQGGDLTSFLNVPYPDSDYRRTPVELPASKWDMRLVSVNTEGIGRLLMDLGGGRVSKGDPIDHTVGLEYRVRLGQVFSSGECIHLLDLIHAVRMPEAKLHTIRDLAKSLFRLARI
jgi:thymidine phosphorylase